MLELILIDNCAFKVMQQFPARIRWSVCWLRKETLSRPGLWKKFQKIPLFALSADLCSRPVKLRQIKKLLKD